jgi:predicted TIM-barrel fold metal-dependent hydrolase
MMCLASVWRLEGLGLDNEAKDMFLYKNAARVFGISQE